MRDRIELWEITGHRAIDLGVWTFFSLVFVIFEVQLALELNDPQPLDFFVGLVFAMISVPTFLCLIQTLLHFARFLEERAKHRGDGRGNSRWRGKS